MQAPYTNCQFRECSLPGQCASEGRCHHATTERSQPDEHMPRVPCSHCNSNYPMHDLSCPVAVEGMKRATERTDEETLQFAARAANALGPISMAQVECVARIVQGAKPATRMWSVADHQSGLSEVYDVFSIGGAMRTAKTLLTNVENAYRRSRCLSAIEREFFTTEVPDDDIPGLTVEDCSLNWGAPPDEYVQQLGIALADRLAAARAALADQVAVTRNATEFANVVIREMAELPDRNSPEDDPEAMIANADEVRGCIESALVHTGLRLTTSTCKSTPSLLSEAKHDR